MFFRFFGLFLFFRLFPRLHRGDAAVDVLALGIELRLVVGHHAALSVCVQVARDLGEGKAKLRDLLDRPEEEGIVVGLEVDLAILLEHLAVEL